MSQHPSGRRTKRHDGEGCGVTAHPFDWLASSVLLGGDVVLFLGGGVMWKARLVVAALACGGGLTPLAAQTITKVVPVRGSATIQSIDAGTRRISLRNDKGEEDSFIAGPEVKRFAELKIGDCVTTNYYESIVLQVRRPGEASNAPGSVQSATTASNTTLPGGTIATQERKTVTVRSVDPSTMSIAVTTEDGKTVRHKVEDRTHFERVRVGDRIDITYTVAFLVSVDRAD